jgi:hypothetical protein
VCSFDGGKEAIAPSVYVGRVIRFEHWAEGCDAELSIQCVKSMPQLLTRFEATMRTVAYRAWRESHYDAIGDHAGCRQAGNSERHAQQHGQQEHADAQLVP